MRPKGTRLPSLVVIASLPLVFCGPVEQEQQDRGVSLVQHDDGSTADAPAMIRRQRELFAALMARDGVPDLVAERFTIRNDYSATASDSNATARQRQRALLRTLDVRAPLDTAVIAQAGDMMTYTDFLTYTLSASQVVVLARDGRGAVLLTSWSRGGSDWRATGMVLDPSQAVLNSLYERAAQ
ncbi:MAG TPA: hypothetical protein VK929_09510 [Longimicrobiales bacterium]|nr:hypothetical protein [Longimicrobiales bacterium]